LKLQLDPRLSGGKLGISAHELGVDVCGLDDPFLHFLDLQHIGREISSFLIDTGASSMGSGVHDTSVVLLVFHWCGAAFGYAFLAVG
jgi:hypothetical protein